MKREEFGDTTKESLLLLFKVSKPMLEVQGVVHSDFV
jgi:hypothetical protein